MSDRFIDPGFGLCASLRLKSRVFLSVDEIYSWPIFRYVLAHLSQASHALGPRAGQHPSFLVSLLPIWAFLHPDAIDDKIEDA